MTMLRKDVYVAASFEETTQVRALYALLRNAGHAITHDWTHESSEGKTDDELAAYLNDCAEADLVGVEECDVLVLLPHKRGKGMYVELGFALAAEKDVICIGDVDEFSCIFFRLDEIIWIKDTSELLAALDALE